MHAILKTLAAFLLLTASSCTAEPPASSAPAAKDGSSGQLLVPKTGAYAGAYIDFGEFEDGVTLEAIEDFDKLAGKKQAVIGFSSYWGRQSFPKDQLRIINAYGALPVVYWNPWDFPYDQHKEQNRFSLDRIASGEWDAYIDMWAKAAKEFGRPMLVSWGLEMNGVWFPWSGFFHGGGRAIPGTNPVLYQGPENFKKAYRHVVNRVRTAGAANVLWVFHPNNTSEPNEPWNRMANYWPGAEYVDWLGLSAYGKQYPGPGWTPFQIVLPEYYAEITRLDPDKPFILAEWGVGEFPESGSKAAWITEALQRLSTEFPRLKASIFWHERWQNGDLSYSNLRVNSSPEALQAYRDGISKPFWLDRPQYK